MEKLPYFLELVKHNSTIAPIVSSGTFTDVISQDIELLKWTDTAIELKNFSLGGDDIFSSVMVSVTDSGTLVIFNSNDPKYFDNSNYYFGKDSLVQKSKPYQIDGREANTVSKSFGHYKLLNNEIRVSVKQSNIYDCAIFLYCKRD